MEEIAPDSPRCELARSMVGPAWPGLDDSHRDEVVDEIIYGVYSRAISVMLSTTAPLSEHLVAAGRAAVQRPLSRAPRAARGCCPHVCWWCDEPKGERTVSPSTPPVDVPPPAAVEAERSDTADAPYDSLRELKSFAYSMVGPSWPGLDDGSRRDALECLFDAEYEFAIDIMVESSTVRITFAIARELAALDARVRKYFGPDATIAEYGWQNNNLYEVAVITPGGPLMDAPAVLVDKATGAVDLKFGLLGKPPASDMTAIGNPPP